MTLKFAPKNKVFLYVIFALINALGNVTVAYTSKIMLDLAQYHRGKLNDLILVAGIGAGTILAIMLANFVYRYIKVDLIKTINVELKDKTMTYLVNKRDVSQKDGLSLMTNDLKQIETLKVTNELMIISELISFVLSIIVGLLNSWILTLIFLTTTLIPGFVQKWFAKPIQKRSGQWEKANAEYTQKVSDALNGARTANLYDAQIPVISQVVESAKRMELALRRLNYAQQGAYEIIVAVADIFSFIIPFLVGSILMYQGWFGAGTLIMIVQLSNEFVNPIVNIFDQINAIKSTKPMWDKIEPALTYQLTESPKFSDKLQELEVDNVSYTVNEKQLFNGLSLKIKPGQKVLLMAPSGWGKTTFLQMLMGQLKPSRGKVIINHQDMSGNYQKAHNFFGYINQKPFIFDNSLKFNLTLGKKVSDSDLNQAIELAGLSELVAEKGLNYELGESGSNLSGGQIQRIEIARALLSKRPILLADEATSALDPAMSLAIHQTLLKNKGITVLEVAHKVSDEELEMFDRIIHLDKLAV
ncbi:ATP-binding cassette domain-containing protein [Lactobacillus pasteurii]|uniref:ABC transporter ATPase and permease components n=1 Tax=Lactobacillus pasteurii DSM 23907 = CRBIP 24.76 TaxID=1423790 RepID=I7JZ55_9LACO|nr:ABC transporter ATP-binding protein [Lactobacillus pasteurii]TDG78156.1 hypothetical protein C5L33_000219 [Lactobacillus pasteurii]CCI86035.1 ABC transporter ATPase and permease components [Lactobacillus pasteurii DSM 23907 = CRBIP 24.76]